MSELDEISKRAPTSSLCDVWEGQMHRKDARNSWDAWEEKSLHHNLQAGPDVLLDQSQVQAAVFDSNP